MIVQPYEPSRGLTENNDVSSTNEYRMENSNKPAIRNKLDIGYEDDNEPLWHQRKTVTK